VTPPRAARLLLAADGRYLAKDEHDNTIDGMRSAQLDMPRTPFRSVSLDGG
jgi:hypothetical protein